MKCLFLSFGKEHLLFERTNSTTHNKYELSWKTLSLSNVLNVFVPGVVIWQISRRTVLSNLFFRPASLQEKSNFIRKYKEYRRVFTLFKTLFHHIRRFCLFDSCDFITFGYQNISKFAIGFFRKATMSCITWKFSFSNTHRSTFSLFLILPFIIVKFNSGAQIIASILSKIIQTIALEIFFYFTYKVHRICQPKE